MNAGFRKRLLAYMIDMLFVSLIFSIITINYSNNKLEDYNKKLNNIMNDYIIEDISMEEYLEEYETIIYNIEKASFYVDVVYLVFSIGYFVVFQYLNNGQTIGKKLMRIKVVSGNGMNAGVGQMLVRTCIINEIFSGIVLLFLLFNISKRVFVISYNVIYGIEELFIFISAVMIFSNNIGLHDIMAKTSVVREDV